MTVWKRESPVELNYNDSDEGGAGNTASVSYGGDYNTIIRKNKDGKDIVWEQYDGYEVCRVQDNGGFSYKKRVVDISEALDLSDVATALPYSGCIFTVDADGGAYAITLPTATSAAEAAQLKGWHASFVLADVHATNDVTIVRGDTSNDEIAGNIAPTAVDANAAGLTIGSNVITFDASAGDAVGDMVEVICYGATASVTMFVARAHCAT
tara:strand:+ start:1150 stop:1779 length:630 start_codon:yes stop_codon:yes gene_type:complete